MAGRLRRTRPFLHPGPRTGRAEAGKRKPLRTITDSNPLRERPNVAKYESFSRRLPIGAEVSPKGGVHFRVWAPNSPTAGLLLGSSADLAGGLAALHEMNAEEGGYFSLFL